MIGFPWLGASASRTFLGITVEKTCAPKKLRRSEATWRESVVRSSYMVNRMPSTAKSGFSVLRILISVSRSSETPSSAKYSHCIGIKTESLATKALSVTRSSAGGQSSMTKRYVALMLSMALRRKYSRPSMETSSTPAPTRFLSAGIRSRPSTCVLRTILSIGSFRMRE